MKATELAILTCNGQLRTLSIELASESINDYLCLGHGILTDR